MISAPLGGPDFNSMGYISNNVLAVDSRINLNRAFSKGATAFLQQDKRDGWAGLRRWDFKEVYITKAFV